MKIRLMILLVVWTVVSVAQAAEAAGGSAEAVVEDGASSEQEPSKPADEPEPDCE